MSVQEAEDYYDAIEWAGVQPWSNGNVGLWGMSYLAMTQHNVASLQPPHLKAMIAQGTPSLDLKRYNLFYGFNGSGKSTLSRIFASLQHGKTQDRLPEGCTFEVEMSDGGKFSSPNALAGLEKRVCVFNNDFISENLRWDSGVANPVFYIGADQAEVAEKLKAVEIALPAARNKREGEAKVLKEREKAFNDYKRVLARTVSERLRQAGRYEATQLVADVEKLGATAADTLNDADLDAATATCARSDAPSKVKPVEVPIPTLKEMLQAGVDLAPKSIGSIMVEELAAHPQMVPWVGQGHEYHLGHDLKSCLYCGNLISDQRQHLLTAAFDDNFSKFTTELNTAAHHAADCVEALAIAKAANQHRHIGSAHLREFIRATLLLILLQGEPRF